MGDSPSLKCFSYSSWKKLNEEKGFAPGGDGLAPTRRLPPSSPCIICPARESWTKPWQHFLPLRFASVEDVSCPTPLPTPLSCFPAGFLPMAVHVCSASNRAVGLSSLMELHLHTMHTGQLLLPGSQLRQITVTVFMWIPPGAFWKLGTSSRENRIYLDLSILNSACGIARESHRDTC